MYRVATINDIAAIQLVRNAVKENRLSDPSFIKDEEVINYIIRRGRGWVAIEENIVIGFSIADLVDNNVWALFIHPDFEAKGHGKKLLDILLNWYFSKTTQTIWLSTAPNTRAAKFYEKQGWKQNGFYGKGELKFEMEYHTWKNQNLKIIL
jgi:ribosomal protein S18 acetylase RimI-like enzyme